jgi:hypothetical protein
MPEIIHEHREVDQGNEGCESTRSTPVSQVQPNCNRLGTAEERTPLPKFQLFLVLLIQFAEPITASVIYPFVNQFVRDTGITRGDDKKTGYYAGVIVSVPFYESEQASTKWQGLIITIVYLLLTHVPVFPDRNPLSSFPRLPQFSSGDGCPTVSEGVPFSYLGHWA